MLDVITDVSLIVKPINLILETDGCGLWSKVEKSINIKKIEFNFPCKEDFDDEENYSCYMYINVYFDTNDWNVDKDDLIYTDDTFLEDLNEYLSENMFNEESIDLDYTEQGMQGDDYVSLEMYVDDTLELFRNINLYNFKKYFNL